MRTFRAARPWRGIARPKGAIAVHTRIALCTLAVCCAAQPSPGHDCRATAGAGRFALSRDTGFCPSDPTADIDWTVGTSGVADVEAAFNDARTTENARLGTSIPPPAMPSQSPGEAGSDGQKALRRVNRTTGQLVCVDLPVDNSHSFTAQPTGAR